MGDRDAQPTHYDGADMKRGDEVQMNITQGAVVVNNAFVVLAHDDVALVCVDMKSKRAVLSSTFSTSGGAVGVSLMADEHTLRLDESKDRESFTDVEFPQFAGWRIFAVDGPARYTMSVVFTRYSV